MQERVFTASAILLGACIGMTAAYTINQYYIADRMPSYSDTPSFSDDGTPSTYVVSGTISFIADGYILVTTQDPFSDEERVLKITIQSGTALQRLSSTQLTHSYPTWSQEQTTIDTLTVGEGVRAFLRIQENNLYAAALLLNYPIS